MSVTYKDVVLPTPFDIDELTQGVVDGSGVFDTLMKTMKEHLDVEFKANRLRGPDYTTAYVGGYAANLQTAMQYVLAKARLGYELELLQAQIDGAKAQAELTAAQTAALVYETAYKAPKEVALIDAQILGADYQNQYTVKQTEALTAQLTKVPHEITLLQKQATQSDAQTEQTTAQTDTIRAQALKVPVEIELLEKQKLQADAQLDVTTAQVAHTTAQTGNVTAQTANVAKQGEQITAQTAQVLEQTKLVSANLLKAPVELSHLEAQTQLVTKQAQKIDKDILLQSAQIDLAYAQLEVSRAELQAKLKQLDLLVAQIAGQQAQSALYAQKVITEKAQVDASVIGAGSVIGTQNSMIKAQTDGFKRDAEQKAAKIFVDTWSVRRNTDNGTSANSDNLLNDATIGAVLTALLGGVGVSPRP